MEAWVSLATNDSYAVGALTLAHSLRRVNTTKQVVLMITEEVSANMKKTLEETFDKVYVVDPLDSKDIANLTLLDRTELGITFTKVESINGLLFKHIFFAASLLDLAGVLQVCLSRRRHFDDPKL